MKPRTRIIAWIGILIFLSGCGFLAFNKDPDIFVPKNIVKTEKELVAGTMVVRLIAESKDSFARDLGEIFFGIPPELNFIEFVVKDAILKDFYKLHRVLNTYMSERYKDSYKFSLLENAYDITAYYYSKENRNPRRSVTQISFEIKTGLIEVLLVCPDACNQKMVADIFNDKEGVPLSPVTKKYYRILKKRLKN